MNGLGKKIKLAVLFSGDAAILYFSLYTTLALRYGELPDEELWVHHFLPFSEVFALWLLIFIIAGLYDLKLSKNEGKFLERLIKTIVVNSALAILVFYMLADFKVAPKTNLLLMILISTPLIFFWRLFFNARIAKTVTNKVLFFGVNEDTVDMADYLRQNPQFGFNPEGLMLAENEDYSKPIPFTLFSSNNKLADIIKQNSIDTIVVSKNIRENKTLVRTFFDIIPLGAAIVDFPEFYENVTGKIPISLIQETWFLEHLVGGKKEIFEFTKRIIDLLIAAALTIPAVIIFPFAALAIKSNSEGPIFFRQKRVGRHGKDFELLKFRSMVKNADEISGYKKEDGPDPRQTRIGKLLRKSYLDELPQVWNIIIGEMSFVGPRPERPEYVVELKKTIPFYEMRLLATPGITGWAQINMENDASVEDAPEKMQYDLFYIKNRSSFLDINIILKTIFTILSRSGR